MKLSSSAPPAHSRAIPFSELRRALVVKLRHHGDVLLSAPVSSSLKQAAPQCEIDALIYSDTQPMLANRPDIALIHTTNRQWKRLGFIATTPVVALFGPSNENEWGPRQVPHRIVTSPYHPCRPCRLDGCGGGKVSDCLASIAPVVVMAAVLSLLEEAA